MTRLRSHVDQPLARSIVRRWLYELHRRFAKFDWTMLWSATVLVAALAALAFGVSSEASDDPPTSNDVAEVPSLSASGVDADQPPRYDVFMDHSVVNEHSTADESDKPGSSIAEWGP